MFSIWLPSRSMLIIAYITEQLTDFINIHHQTLDSGTGANDG